MGLFHGTTVDRTITSSGYQANSLAAAEASSRQHNNKSIIQLWLAKYVQLQLGGLWFRKLCF